MAIEPAAEQVGFVTYHETSEISLRMAGGEFCGNATMSAAIMFFEKCGLGETDSREVLVHASGCGEPVSVMVTGKSRRTYYGCVQMPRPAGVSSKKLTFGKDTFVLPAVEFEGITHLIAEYDPDDSEENGTYERTTNVLLNRSIAEEAVKQWAKEEQISGLGLMLVDTKNKRIDPLVYVSSPETLFWESSCASGTTAVGAFLAARSGKATAGRFTEPGGIIQIEAEPGGQVKLTGQVRFIKQAKADIEL